MTPRLFLHVAAQEVRRTLTFRFDFWFQATLTFLAEWALAWFLWRGVFDASGAAQVGGFTFEQAVRYTLLVALVGKLIRGSFLDAGIASEIYDGSLSRYLVYPVSTYGFKYAQHVGTLLPALLQLLLFGLVWRLAEGPAALSGMTAGGALKAVVSVALGNVLLFALAWPIQGVAFWAENVWSLMVALRFVGGLLGGMLLPLSLFPPGLGALLTWLPFRYLFAFPVEVLTGTVDTRGWLLGLLVLAAWTVVFRWLGAWVWRRGERVYAGAGM